MNEIAAVRTKVRAQKRCTIRAKQEFERAGKAEENKGIEAAKRHGHPRFIKRHGGKEKREREKKTE